LLVDKHTKASAKHLVFLPKKKGQIAEASCPFSLLLNVVL
jgi:hypothetical protein